jgi:glucokinase
MEAPGETSQPHGGFVLGIDLGGTKTAVVTAGLDGTPLSVVRLPTRADEGAYRVISRVVGAARDLVQDRAATAGPFLAVGAVSPGIVLEDSVLLAPNNPGWETLALARELRRGLRIDEVVVDTDAKAAAVAEIRWGELAGIRDGIFVNLGTGIAVALVVDGRVVRGAHGAAGEIGYEVRGTPGEAVYADGCAPLEDQVSGRAIGERASALIGRKITAAEAFAMMGRDRRVAELIDEALGVLGVHLANLAIAADPERIVVGGGMMGSRSVVIPRLADAMRRTVPFPPDVRVARFLSDAPLYGAIALALTAIGSMDSTTQGAGRRRPVGAEPAVAE